MEKNYVKEQGLKIARLEIERDRLQAELAALREQEPVAKVLSDQEMGIGHDRRGGPVLWLNGYPAPGWLYAAPLVSDKAGAYDFGAPMARVLAQFGLDGAEAAELASELAVALIPHLMQWAEDSDLPTAQSALKWIVRNYPNPDLSHVDYRVEACRRAESALNPLAADVAQGGEVERLRAEVKRLELAGAQSDFSYDQRIATQTARAEDAERENAELHGECTSVLLRADKLTRALRNAVKFVENWDDDSQEWIDLKGEIDNLLATPAPAEQKAQPVRTPIPVGYLRHDEHSERWVFTRGKAKGSEAVFYANPAYRVTAQPVAADVVQVPREAKRLTAHAYLEEGEPEITEYESEDGRYVLASDYLELRALLATRQADGGEV